MKKLFISFCLATGAIILINGFNGTPISAYANPLPNEITQLQTSNTQQTIILDGRILHTSAPLQVVNNRLLVPFREIGEAMQANVNWQGDLQRITMFRGNRYSIMHVGQTNVQFGEFNIDSSGNVVFTTQQFIQMDAPAVIINNLTYIPLRAISETLGATVNWNESTSTATIVSANIINITPTPAPVEPEPEPEEEKEVLPPNYGNFSNTNFFRTISSRQAQSRFQDSNAEPFILVAYDSTSDNSKRLVPDIIGAAQTANVRIYGLDKSADNTNASDNSWMWSFVRESNFRDPTIFYVHSRTNVRVDANPNINNLEQTFRNFNILTETGFETGDFRNTNYFRNVTSREIESMNRSNEEFIFVLYDSTDDESAFYVPILKAAAREAEHRIYAVDIDTNPSYHNHLNFAPGIESSIHRRIPMMFLVYSDNNRNRTEVYERPQNVDTGVSVIEEFITNSLYYTNNNNNNNNNNQQFQDIDHNYFRNISSSEATTKFRRGEEFIIVVYDSKEANSRVTVERIRDAAIVAGPPIFGLNMSSTRFNNTIREDLLWLNLIPSNTRYPVMIHYSNQRLGDERFMSFWNINSDDTFNDAFRFIQRVY